MPIDIDQDKLQVLFADKVLLALLEENLLTEEDIDNMKSWQHSGFNVFIGEPIDHNDKDRLLFAAGYLKKCPLSNERIKIVEASGKESLIEYASFKNGTKNVRTFTPLEFLAAVSQHNLSRRSAQREGGFLTSGNRLQDFSAHIPPAPGAPLKKDKRSLLPTYYLFQNHYKNLPLAGHGL